MDRTQPDMLLRESGLHRSFRHRLSIRFASSAAEVREAQRLRYQVFAEEMRARLPSREPGIDSDSFDPYCDHLLVRDTATNQVVGTYRVLSSAQAKRIGGLYSDEEFDLVRLAHLRDRMVEVGRSCVHADYRNGATIAMLWSGLGEYMVERGHDYLIGCASISMADGGHVAASVYNRLKQDYLSPVEHRVFPRCPLPLHALNGTLVAPTPPLIKGYLRLGAYICGEPAWDPDFNTADLLILLPLSRLTPRYRKHFLKE
jgi:putative hemolysin